METELVKIDTVIDTIADSEKSDEKPLNVEDFEPSWLNKFLHSQTLWFVIVIGVLFSGLILLWIYGPDIPKMNFVTGLPAFPK